MFVLVLYICGIQYVFFSVLYFYATTGIPYVSSDLCVDANTSIQCVLLVLHICLNARIQRVLLVSRFRVTPSTLCILSAFFLSLGYDQYRIRVLSDLYLLTCI